MVGKGEILLSLILPEAYKSTGIGDLKIQELKTEVKGLYSKSGGTGALLTGNSTKSIDKTQNKDFITSLLISVCKPIYENIYKIILKYNSNNITSYTDFYTKDLLKLKNIIFNTRSTKSFSLLELMEMIQTSNKSTIEDFFQDFTNNKDIVQAFNICQNGTAFNFILNSINLYNILLKEPSITDAIIKTTQNITPQKIDINIILQRAFKNLFSSLDDNNINELVEKLLQSPNNSNNIVSINSLAWNNIIGRYCLKNYLTAEEDKYFICCININQTFGIEIFDIKNDPNFMFNNEFINNYDFDTISFQDKTACTSRIRHR